MAKIKRRRRTVQNAAHEGGGQCPVGGPGRLRADENVIATKGGGAGPTSKRKASSRERR